MRPELPLLILILIILDLCAGQVSASTISLIRELSPSEKRPCGGPWSLLLCPIVLLSFMGDKARIDGH